MINNFGQRLAQLLTSKQMTQGEFARVLGASPAFISDMIRGVKKPGADFLSRLASHFQVSLDWLLLGKGTLEGNTSIDEEWFQVVVLRVELARLAADGHKEALLLVDELMGKIAPQNLATPAREELLSQLAKANDKSALISDLYNRFFTNSDQKMRASEVLSLALIHFQSNNSDPLAVMVAAHVSSTHPHHT